MAKNKLGLQFSGWDEVIANLDSLGGDIKKTTENALLESQKIVARNAQTAMKKHRRTGKTENSISDDGTVTWIGSTAQIGVGFDLKSGGMPSIFLMYGTPRKAKDQAVYNAVYGSGTKKEISEKQSEIFYKEISERMG